MTLPEEGRPCAVLLALRVKFPSATLTLLGFLDSNNAVVLVVVVVVVEVQLLLLLQKLNCDSGFSSSNKTQALN